MPRRPPRPVGPVLAALDEVRFGAANILNLRARFPTGADAEAQVEAWLRERQVARAAEVLVVTGRGLGSEGGVPVVRAAVARRCALLKRRGVVATVQEHTPGSLLITLAKVTAMLDAPQRSRHHDRVQRRDPAALSGLSPETRTALRALAQRSLHDLGARGTAATGVDAEMMLLFARLSPGATSEATLRGAIQAAMDELDAR